MIIKYTFLTCFSFYSFCSYGYDKIPLNENWLFAPGYAYNMQKQPPWQEVDLPHTWNADDVTGGNLAYYRGLGVYKRSVNIAASQTGKRFFLKFEGSTLVTDVYVNGQYAGHHKGGYTAFTIEITDFVKTGADNELLVMVNNAWTSEVMPLVGDFNIYGGIHRPVHLLVRDEVCIDLLNHGSPGIFITQKEVSEEKAEISIAGTISNEAGAEKNLVIQTTIKDAENKPAWSGEKTMTVAAKSEGSWDQQVTLNQPRLWQGRKDPHLYSVEILVRVDGKAVDQSLQPLGLRYFTLDPGKGLFLNGTYTDVRGVCYHEAKAGKGSALAPADYQQDFAIMLEMGVNAIRTAHYPHAEYFYKMCDSLGIIVYTEIPMVGPGGYLGRGFMNSEDFKANGKSQLKELIRQNYNHPSILFWGLYNEVKINGDDPHEYILALQKIAKQEDPHRLTMAATFQDNHNNDITDAIGWNRYFGWYGGNPREMGTWADKMHERFPGRPLAVSEYGAGASIHHHSDSLVAPKPSGRWHPEEWQAHYHEENWQELKKRPFVWGKFIWLMFDFGAVHRSEGDKTGVNDKGIVTADRKVKKDAYHFYKANWNPEPMLVLAEKRYVKRVRPQVRIKAYTNLKQVEFFLNGKSVGKANARDGKALSPIVQLRPGENSIEVKGRSKGKKMNDTVTWIYQ